MAIQDVFNELKSVDFNELSLDNIGSWPFAVKLITWILVLVLCICGGIYYRVLPLTEQLESDVQKEFQLKQEFERKAFKASNLKALRAQMAEMEETFGALLSQLPTDTEVPGLLEDITDKAVAHGLEISEIKLQPEATREFYIELPISVKVKGSYHDLAGFVSGIAGLPRIVTLHDFSIKSAKGAGQLDMSITAKTYRYRDPEAES